MDLTFERLGIHIFVSWLQGVRFNSQFHIIGDLGLRETHDCLWILSPYDSSQISVQSDFICFAASGLAKFLILSKIFRAVRLPTSSPPAGPCETPVPYDPSGVPRYALSPGVPVQFTSLSVTLHRYSTASVQTFNSVFNPSVRYTSISLVRYKHSTLCSI